MNEPRKNTSNIDRAIKGYLNFRKKNNGYIGGEYISMLDAANYHKFSNPYQKLMNERGDFERLRKSILYYFHDIKLEDQMVFNREDDDVYSFKYPSFYTFKELKGKPKEHGSSGNATSDDQEIVYKSNFNGSVKERCELVKAGFEMKYGKSEYFDLSCNEDKSKSSCTLHVNINSMRNL